MNRFLTLYLKVYHFWMRFPEKVRFLLVGGYNTSFSYGLYALFLWLTGGAAAQTALLLSFILSTPHSYLTQKFFVFATRGNYGREYLTCVLSWAISYGLNILLLQGFLVLGLNAYLAQLIALILVTINSYLMLKYLAFHRHQKTG